MGRDDVQVMIRAKFSSEFTAFERLTALAQELFDRQPEKFAVAPRRPSTAVVAALFAKAWKTTHAIHLLARQGYGEDAVDLARTLTNVCIDLGYICHNDSDKRARIWGAAGRLERLKVKQGIQKGKLSKADQSRYRRLKVMAKPWTDLNIKGRARCCGRMAFYEISFRHGSSYSHSDSWSAASFLKRNAEAIEALNAPGEADVGDALFIAAMAIFDIVVTCGRFYQMDTTGLDAEMRRVIEIGFDSRGELNP